MSLSGGISLWRWQSAWHDQSRVMRLHREHHDQKTPLGKVGLHRLSRLCILRQRVFFDSTRMKRNQLLRKSHSQFHSYGLHLFYLKMSLSLHLCHMVAFSMLQDKCMYWEKNPTSHTRRSDKSCLVTLDPSTAVDSSPSNSMQDNEQFKFSMYTHVCYILESALHCVRADNCGLRRNLKLNHLVPTKGTRNFFLYL